MYLGSISITLENLISRELLTNIIFKNRRSCAKRPQRLHAAEVRGSSTTSLAWASCTFKLAKTQSCQERA